MKVHSKAYFEYLKEGYSKIDKDKYYNRYILLNIKKNFCILDIGCGFGFLLQKLNNTINDLSTIGVDINLYALKYAKKIVPKTHLIEAVADKLPFSDKKFDAIFATDLIEHLQNPSAFLKGVQRVLKDNGRLILSTPDRFSVYLVLGKNIIEQLLFNILRILGVAKIDPTHVKEFTVYKLSSLLFSNGFVIEKCNRYKMRFVPFHLSGSMIICCRKMCE